MRYLEDDIAAIFDIFKDDSAHFNCLSILHCICRITASCLLGGLQWMMFYVRRVTGHPRLIRPCRPVRSVGTTWRYCRSTFIAHRHPLLAQTYTMRVQSRHTQGCFSGRRGSTATPIQWRAHAERRKDRTGNPATKIVADRAGGGVTSLYSLAASTRFGRTTTLKTERISLASRWRWLLWRHYMASTPTAISARDSKWCQHKYYVLRIADIDRMISRVTNSCLRYVTLRYVTNAFFFRFNIRCVERELADWRFIELFTRYLARIEQTILFNRLVAVTQIQFANGMQDVAHAIRVACAMRTVAGDTATGHGPHTAASCGAGKLFAVGTSHRFSFLFLSQLYLYSGLLRSTNEKAMHAVIMMMMALSARTEMVRPGQLQRGVPSTHHPTAPNGAHQS